MHGAKGKVATKTLNVYLHVYMWHFSLWILSAISFWATCESLSAFTRAPQVCPPLLLTSSWPRSQAASMSERKFGVSRILSKVGTAWSPRTSASWNIWSLLRTFKYPLTSTKSPIPAWEQCHFWRSKEPQSWYFACKHVKSYDTTCIFNMF